MNLFYLSAASSTKNAVFVSDEVRNRKGYIPRDVVGIALGIFVGFVSLGTGAGAQGLAQTIVVGQGSGGITPRSVILGEGTGEGVGGGSPWQPAPSPYGLGGPPAGFFSPAMANMASRYETYCAAGVWPCVEVYVREYGQTCHAPVKGGSPYHDGFIPPGFTYTRWRCTLSPDQAVGGAKVLGEGYN